MRGARVDNRTNALAAWGAPLPDWVEVLVRQCDQVSQSEVAKTLRVSAALVNTVLRNKYNGDMAGIENSVRGAFMNAMVNCPVLGTIPTHDCQDWQRKSTRFVNINAQRVQMFRACARCPQNRHRKAAFNDLSHDIEIRGNSDE